MTQDKEVVGVNRISTKFKNRDIPLVDLACCAFEQGICGVRYRNGDIAYFVGLWRRNP